MKLSSELRRTIAKARTVIETRSKINAAIETAVSLQPAAEARLQDALEALGTAEAEAAIEGGVAPSGAAHGALTDARMSADVLAARIQGLRRRLSTQEQEIQAVTEDLRVGRERFTRDTVDEYREQLAKAAADFTAVLKQGAALADALDFGVMEMAIRGISVVDPLDAGRRLVDLDLREYSVSSGWQVVSMWRGDAAAEGVFKAHSEPVDVARALNAAQ